MPTTEELFTRLGAVLDHGPVSSSSLQYAIATLAELAQRTRDLAGERDRLREALENHGEHDSRCVLSRWEAGEPTPEGYKTKYDGKWYGKDSLPKCQCGFDAALAPAEAGSGEADEEDGLDEAAGCAVCGGPPGHSHQFAHTATPEPAEAGSGEAAKLSFVGVRATRSCDACGREHLPSPTPEPDEARDGEMPPPGFGTCSCGNVLKGFAPKCDPCIAAMWGDDA